MAMGGKLGLNVSLKNLLGNFSNDAAALFSESQGRIIATIAPKDKKRFEQKLMGTVYACIGTVTSNEKIVIRSDKKTMKFSLSEILRAYRSTFRNY